MKRSRGDVLGQTFHDLELHNKWAGKFFTPYSVCQMMAKMTLSKEDAEAIIAERGFVRASGNSLSLVLPFEDARVPRAKSPHPLKRRKHA